MNEQVSILIIDDDRMITKILQSSLSRKGFKAYIAEEGMLGVEIARKENIDVILLDWMMPGVDGMEVLRKLKSNEKTRSIPVFMLTSKEGGHEIDQAISLGADDYIVKPFNVSEIHTMIKEKLKKIGDAGINKKTSFFARVFSKSD